MKKGSRVGSVTPGDVKSLAAKNLAKQVGEVYTAATKGKSGTQSAKLTSIKENLAMNPSISKKVGPIGGGSPIPTRPGVKNIARDTARGFWDFTYGSYSPNSLTTDGRGGSQ
jgi:hypothetical protein